MSSNKLTQGQFQTMLGIGGGICEQDQERTIILNTSGFVIGVRNRIAVTVLLPI